MSVIARIWINASDLADEWGVSRDYIRSAMRRKDDPLPLRPLPGKKNNPVGLWSEVEAWRVRNSTEGVRRG